MIYRSRKLLDAARDVPHCMGCLKSNDGTVVAAHSNQSRDGKGMGIKASDYRIAYLCQCCHSAIDQGKGMSRHERIAYFEEAHRRSVGWLFESGKVLAA